MRDRIKWLLFPGVNLHGRLRNEVLPQHFARPDAERPKRVLDAGCGNGMLAYQSYKLGNEVTGLSIKQGEVERNSRLFHQYLGESPERLKFRVQNLYELDDLEGPFDEIICTEVLEHIRDDAKVAASFFRLLAPGGTLHVTTPNADHPYHASFPLDPDETGGHVRPGYTEQTYRELFEPLGFEVESPIGLGGRMRQAVNNRIIRGEERFGYPAALAVFLAGGLLAKLDGPEPDVPFSWYVKVRKPSDVTTNSPSNVATATPPELAGASA